MRANPGGEIAPSEVIGRDKLIEYWWSILERQSLILSAERRMGKTCAIKKMKAEAPPDKITIYRDLENVRSPLEFVETVLEDVETYLDRLQLTARGVRQFLTQLSGLEFQGFKLPSIAATHWKTLLIKTIEYLVENQEHTVILFWDEMPYMLGNIGEEAAMEVLDTLRSLRQMHPAVRMVYTGSIGLHHLIGSLRQAGYRNDPINDMYPVDLPPLSLTDATELTRLLIEGENISTLDIQMAAPKIAQAVDCIPFYIHHLIVKLKLRGTTFNETTVTEAIDNCLLDPLNPWKMDHYRERIDNYYSDEQRAYALNSLDILAPSKNLKKPTKKLAVKM